MTRFFLLAAKVAMRSFVLIIGVGLLAARVAHAADCDITSKLFQPDANYTPVAPGLARAATPSCTTPDNQNGPTIKKAFDLAPDLLRADLCSLKCIVVLPPGSGSWGKWANNKNPKYGGDGSAAIGIDTNDLTVKLSDKLNKNLIGVPGLHVVTPQSNDTAERALMYTLAHEMAHIKWRRDFANGINAQCTVDKFIGTSWNGHAGSKERRWTYFGDEFGNIKNSIKFPSEVTSDNDTYNIYMASPGAFATVLGATNPEEDFVESYAIAALIAANKGNTTTTLTLPTSGQTITVDDPNYRGNTDLKTKMQTCAGKILQSAMVDIDRGGVYPQKKGHGRKRR